MKKTWIAKILSIIDYLCVFAIFVWPANIIFMLLELLEGNGVDVLLPSICVIYLIWRIIFITCDSCLFQVLRIGINKKITILKAGWRYSNKDGEKDRRYTKKNRLTVDIEVAYPCYNCNQNIIRENPFGVGPKSNNDIEIPNSFSYKYNSLVKKVFISVIVVLIAFPIIVEALENPPYERPPKNPVIEIVEEEAIGKEHNTEKTYSNAIQDNDGVKKDTIIDTEKLLYQINDPDGWTNMRESPNGKIIRTVDTVERFEIIGQNENWKMIQLENNQKGFIHNSRIVIAN